MQVHYDLAGATKPPTLPFLGRKGTSGHALIQRSLLFGLPQVGGSLHVGDRQRQQQGVRIPGRRGGSEHAGEIHASTRPRSEPVASRRTVDRDDLRQAAGVERDRPALGHSRQVVGFPGASSLHHGSGQGRL